MSYHLGNEDGFNGGRRRLTFWLKTTLTRFGLSIVSSHSVPSGESLLDTVQVCRPGSSLTVVRGPQATGSQGGHRTGARKDVLGGWLTWVKWGRLRKQGFTLDCMFSGKGVSCDWVSPHLFFGKRTYQRR